MAKGLWISSDKRYAINTDMIIAIQYIKATSMTIEQIEILMLNNTKITLIDKNMYEFLEFMGMGRE